MKGWVIEKWLDGTSTFLNLIDARILEVNVVGISGNTRTFKYLAFGIEYLIENRRFVGNCASRRFDIIFYSGGRLRSQKSAVWFYLWTKLSTKYRRSLPRTKCRLFFAVNSGPISHSDKGYFDHTGTTYRKMPLKPFMACPIWPPFS